MAPMPPMDGLYNIQRQRGDTYTHYASVKRLTSLEKYEDERRGLIATLRGEIQQYLNDGGFPPNNEVLEYVFGDQSIGEYPSDRTMWFYIGILDAFRPALIRRIQERVLNKFPLWRLVAAFEELTIGIYPSGIWLADTWVEDPWDETHPAFQAWLQAAELFREARFGPLRRQLAYVKRLIPSSIERAQAEGICLVACFDCYPPHDPGHAVWLLRPGNREKLWPPKNVGRLRSSRATRQGEIYGQFDHRFEPYTKRKPQLWLDTYLLDPGRRHRIELLNQSDEVVGEILVREIISDKRLEKAERRLSDTH